MLHFARGIVITAFVATLLLFASPGRRAAETSKRPHQGHAALLAFDEPNIRNKRQAASLDQLPCAGSRRFPALSSEGSVKFFKQLNDLIK